MCVCYTAAAATAAAVAARHALTIDTCTPKESTVLRTHVTLEKILNAPRIFVFMPSNSHLHRQDISPGEEA